MAADIFDLPFIHHDDPVSIEDRGKAMGNNNRCPTLHQPGQCELNRLFGLGVKR